MEGTPKTEKPISPEEFFANKIEIHKVSKEEFFDMIKKEYPEISDEDAQQLKGVGFDKGDKAIILMRTDIFPEKYMPYLEIHEKWEAYIARKNGYNLFHKAIRKYKEDKNIKNLDDDNDLKNLVAEVDVYNYDFRHEYATYKEYEQAEKDGKLDEYHEWISDLREKEKPNVNEKNLKMIENDTKIRESIYRKIKEGGTHVFLRN